jgi:hypothetical protein
MTRIMAAHQPNYLPYGGFFAKMDDVNSLGDEPGVFIIRDELQFDIDGYTRRNRIRIAKNRENEPDWKWLTVPVVKAQRDEKIFNIEIDNDRKFRDRSWIDCHLSEITFNYKKTPHFRDFFPGLEQIYLKSHKKLADLNLELIKYIANCFEIKTEIVTFQGNFSESINGKNATETLANLTRHVNAEIYLSGSGARNYLEVFCDANSQGCNDVDCKEKHYIKCSDGSSVEAVFQNWHHPIYQQRYPGFVPNMAAIDMLFNVGKLMRQL